MGLILAWVRFWFTPVAPIGLHTIRLLAGMLFLAWLLPLAGQREALFGLTGWFDRTAYADASRLLGGPPQPISWSVLYICGSNSTVLSAVYWLAIGVLVSFTLGLWPRFTAVLTWVIVLSFMANPASAAEADALLSILAFYLMIGYGLPGLGDFRQSWAARVAGPKATWPLSLLLGRARNETDESLGANLALRLMQVHFAVVVFVNGLHKLQFGDWWSGVALWYALHPPFQTVLGKVRLSPGQADSYLAMLSVAAYAVLAWQIAFPCFAWRSRWRLILLGGAAISWCGTALVYDLPLFGPTLFVGCLSYLSAAEWNWLATVVARAPGMHRLSRVATVSVVPAPQRV
jgi:hypothetical protein